MRVGFVEGVMLRFNVCSLLLIFFVGMFLGHVPSKVFMLISLIIFLVIVVWVCFDLDC